MDWVEKTFLTVLVFLVLAQGFCFYKFIHYQNISHECRKELIRRQMERVK